MPPLNRVRIERGDRVRRTRLDLVRRKSTQDWATRRLRGEGALVAPVGTPSEKVGGIEKNSQTGGRKGDKSSGGPNGQEVRGNRA